MIPFTPRHCFDCGELVQAGEGCAVHARDLPAIPVVCKPCALGRLQTDDSPARGEGYKLGKAGTARANPYSEGDPRRAAWQSGYEAGDQARGLIW